jgi:cell division septum initiation protein DivIVA
MGVYDQIKTAFQDIIAPELHALRSDLLRIEQKIDSVDARLTGKIDALKTETLSMKAELLAEIRRLDARVDSLDRELKTAIEIRERLVALEARLHS